MKHFSQILHFVHNIRKKIIYAFYNLCLKSISRDINTTYFQEEANHTAFHTKHLHRAEQWNLL